MTDSAYYHLSNSQLGDHQAVDWSNVPEVFEERLLPDGEPSIFFLSVHDRLKQVSVSSRSGNPIMSRSSRVWGWFTNLSEPLLIVQGNLTDIHECSYEYAMIEQIPHGMSPYGTREWWWKWSVDGDRWIASSRPSDYKNVLGLTLG